MITPRPPVDYAPQAPRQTARCGAEKPTIVPQDAMRMLRLLLLAHGCTGLGVLIGYIAWGGSMPCA